jgi:hypothetical protein
MQVLGSGGELMKPPPRWKQEAWDRRSLVEDLLARGVRDWVDVAEFVYVSRRSGLDDREGLRALALGLMTEMMVRRLMVPGDVDEFGFQPWPSTLGEAIQRLVETWDEGELSPTPGSVAWFELTPEGNRLGRLIHAREQPPG